ncbi:MAG: hypothetical protein K0U64_03445 [Actinomycetia bacterium]|nr:hypothetical protein [Actinomycetes bacterium]
MNHLEAGRSVVESETAPRGALGKSDAIRASRRALAEELVAEHALELLVDLEAELALRSTDPKSYPWFVVDTFEQRDRNAGQARST